MTEATETTLPEVLCLITLVQCLLHVKMSVHNRMHPCCSCFLDLVWLIWNIYVNLEQSMSVSIVLQDMYEQCT